MEALRFALLGLGAGAVYMLAGQGLVLVYRGSGIINFAQGAMGMVGAFLFYELREARDVATPVAFAIAVLATGVLGLALHIAVMKPLRRAPAVARLLGPLAVMAVLLALANLRYGSQFVRLNALLPRDTVRPFADTPIGVDRIWMFGIGVVVALALAAIFRWSKLGLATAAVAENRRAGAALGISPDVVAGLNWAAAGMLATAAAVLTASLSGTLNVTALVLLVIPGLAAALVGNFHSFLLTAVGATAIGVSESLMARYVTTPGWAKSVPFLVIIAVLILRGKGLPTRDNVVHRPPEIGSGRINPAVVVGVSAVVLVLIWTSSHSTVDAIITTCATALIVLSMVVVVGYCGQLSLAQYAIAGMGAWVSARLVANYGIAFPLAVLAGVLAAVPIGMLVGIPALRARGANLAIATLGLALVLENLIFGNPARTGGSYGTSVGTPSLFGLKLDTISKPERYATVVLVALVVAMLAVANLRRGRAGRRLLAVRANERAAASLGIGLYGAKLYAFGLAAAVAALGGVLLVFRNPVVVFGDFEILSSINAALVSVIGGVGFVGGSLIGALLSPGTITQRVIDLIFGSGLGAAQALGIIGAAGALVALLLYPDGLASFYSRSWHALVNRWTRATRTASAFDAIVPTRGEAFGGGVTTVNAAALDVRGATVRFGGVVAVDGVDLRVCPGQVVGLIGPNGAGKTTFIDAVTGFVPLAEGSVSIGEDSIERLGAAGRARLGLARSFQSLELFENMTVLENLQVASDERDWSAYLTDLVRPRARPLPPFALAAIEEFDLYDHLHKRPSEISFGTRRLVAIARAVASGPAVLLLDEPAAGLSRHETDELGRLIRRLSERWGIGVLVVEHDVGLILNVCDQVTVLDAGRVIATGAPADIRHDEAVLDAYLGKHADDTAHQTVSASALRVPLTPRGLPILEAVGLSAGYDTIAAVHDIALHVNAGEIVALLGSNGAGKSTTLLSLAGELAPMTGEVHWQGESTNEALHRRARGGLGLITEERSVFMGLSCAANLRLGRGPSNEAIELFPELEQLLSRRAGLLSGGEQQMLTLARALAARPSLLLADELSLGLAPLVVDRLFEALRRSADDGLGVLLVEQQARRALDVADRVYVLNRGRIVLEGTSQELRSREDEVHASYLEAV